MVVGWDTRGHEREPGSSHMYTTTVTRTVGGQRNGRSASPYPDDLTQRWGVDGRPGSADALDPAGGLPRVLIVSR